jgi:hypothetical protein
MKSRERNQNIILIEYHREKVVKIFDFGPRLLHCQSVSQMRKKNLEIEWQNFDKTFEYFPYK